MSFDQQVYDTSTCGIAAQGHACDVTGWRNGTSVHARCWQRDDPMEMPLDLDRPPIIAFMSSDSARTQFILENRAYIESLPFEGMVINIPASWSAMSPGVVIREGDVREWLAPLADFNANKFNYLVIENNKPGDLFDDAAWAQAAANWRVIATVAQETGFRGILFDNEEYAAHWDNFPDDVDAAGRARGLDAYRAQAQARGLQIMQGVVSVFPAAQIAVAHGPYLSVPPGAGAVPAITLQAGGWQDQELSGPFFTGLVAGAAAAQTVIDAGELYALRSADDFAASRAYRNALGPLIPWPTGPDVVTDWSARVDAGHMIYTNTYPEGFDQSPASLTTTLRNALPHSEGAVFIFTEAAHADFFIPNAGADAWIAAVRAALQP